MSDEIETPETPPTPPETAKPATLDFADKLLAVERQRAEAERLRQEEREQFSSTVESLKDDVKALRQKLDGDKPDPNDPWGQVSDEQLASVLAKGSDEEGAAGRYKVAFDELLKRRERKLVAEVEARRAFDDKKKMELAHTARQMEQLYGKDITTEGSELRRRAQQHMQALERRYGEEVGLDPKAQLLAASLAHNDQLRAQAEKAKEQEQELARLKARTQMEGGNKVIHKPGDDTKALLKAGKVDAAVKSLNLYQRLFGEG